MTYCKWRLPLSFITIVFINLNLPKLLQFIEMLAKYSEEYIKFN